MLLGDYHRWLLAEIPTGQYNGESCEQKSTVHVPLLLVTLL